MSITTPVRPKKIEVFDKVSIQDYVKKATFGLCMSYLFLLNNGQLWVPYNLSDGNVLLRRTPQIRWNFPVLHGQAMINTPSKKRKDPNEIIFSQVFSLMKSLLT